jgi:hypothetical protein
MHNQRSKHTAYCLQTNPARSKPQNQQRRACSALTPAQKLFPASRLLQAWTRPTANTLLLFFLLSPCKPRRCTLQLAEKELQVAMLKQVICDSEDSAVLQQQLAEVRMAL